jgi:mutator protein MutT
MCASGLIINSLQEVLLLRRSSSDNFLPGFWELPGGRMDNGENLVSGLKREVEEETGLQVIPTYPLKAVSYYEDPIYPRESYGVFYLCKVESENQQVVISSEHDEFKWVSFEKIESFNINGYIKDILLDIKTHPLLKMVK